MVGGAWLLVHMAAGVTSGSAVCIGAFSSQRGSVLFNDAAVVPWTANNQHACWLG